LYKRPVTPQTSISRLPQAIIIIIIIDDTNDIILSTEHICTCRDESPHPQRRQGEKQASFSSDGFYFTFPQITTTIIS